MGMEWTQEGTSGIVPVAELVRQTDGDQDAGEERDRAWNMQGPLGKERHLGFVLAKLTLKNVSELYFCFREVPNIINYL